MESASPGPLIWVKPLLLGGGLPLVVSLAVLALTRRRRAAAGTPSGWGGALAVGGGYLAGHAALAGGPPVPPLERVDWLWCLTAAAVAVCTVAALLPPRAWLRWGLRVPLAGAVLVLLLLPFLKTWGHGETMAWLAGLGAAGVVLWAALDSLAGRGPGTGAPLLLVVLALGSTLVLLLSGSAVYGQLGLALTASLAGSLAAACWAPSLLPPRGLATVVGVVLPGLWLLGYFYAEVPAASAALLAAALPVAALVLVRPVRERLRPWQAVLVGVLALLVPVTAAVVTAYTASPPDPYR
jgi:hypothetical protein